MYYLLSHTKDLKTNKIWLLIQNCSRKKTLYLLEQVSACLWNERWERAAATERSESYSDEAENYKSKGHKKTFPGDGIWPSSAPRETCVEKQVMQQPKLLGGNQCAEPEHLFGSVICLGIEIRSEGQGQTRPEGCSTHCNWVTQVSVNRTATGNFVKLKIM